MSGKEALRFVKLLELELANSDIALPSLPDVVIRIRRAIEADSADTVRISQADSVDPALTCRLFVFANSAY